MEGFVGTTENHKEQAQLLVLEAYSKSYFGAIFYN